MKGYIHKTFEYLFYAVSFGLPLLRPNWHGILLAGLTVCWTLTRKPKDLFNEVVENKIIWVFFGVFLIDVVGLLHTENITYGLSYLETKIPLIILPLIVLSSSSLLPARTIRNIMIAFVAGVITLNLASLGFISYDLWDPQRLESNLIIANNAIVKIHPVFLSAFISFSLFFIIDAYFPLQKANRNKLGWVLFSCTVLLVYLIWLNSRIGILGFLVALSFYIIYALRKVKRLYAFAGMAVLIFILLTVPFSRERFFVAPYHELTEYSKVDLNDYNTRTLFFRREIYSCCIELMKGPEFFYGYGTGDFKDVLQNCYAGNNYSLLIEHNLDAHSEYFAQMHREGIIGLLFFLALLVIAFYYAMKYKSPLFGSFMVLFALTAAFENIMSSQKGVTFVSLFCPLLFLYAKKNWEGKEVNSVEL